MNINIIAVGGIKEIFYEHACKEYLKRLSRFGKMNIIEIDECQGKNGVQDVQKEGSNILKKINKGDFVVALCIEGAQQSSVQFADFMQQTANCGFGSITFIIGGSDGLSEDVKRAASKQISFSKMTFPHQLMRVILLEQIYRGFKILGGESYHK